MKTLITQIPSRLRRQAGVLDELNQVLAGVLPAEMRPHVQAAGVQRNVLVLEADSTAWASKARYLANDITRRMSTGTGLAFTSVKVSIRPSASAAPRPKRAKPRLSDGAAEQFRTLATSETHPALRRALLRLSRRG